MKRFKTLFRISVSDLSDGSGQVEHETPPEFGDDSGQVNYEKKLNAVVAPSNYWHNKNGSMLRFHAISLELL